MKNSLLIFTLLLAAASCGTRATEGSFTRFVDPMIGSGGHGHVFVGASVPFGAVQAGPVNIDKGWDWCSGYHFGDSLIVGFAQTHLSGTGIGDLGDVPIMPYTGEVRLGQATDQTWSEGYGSLFSHDNENVAPGYYSVLLDTSGIGVELTASARVAFHKYKFPEGADGRIIVDLEDGISDRTTESYIEQRDAETFVGTRFSRGWARRQQLYFAIKTSLPIEDFRTFEGDSLVAAGTKGVAVKGLFSFASAPREIMLKVGVSPVSVENALANIEAEIPDWDFEGVRRAADGLWNDELSKIVIETPSEADKKTFYTALYHTMINPALFNDANGEYRGADWEVHGGDGFDNYSVFSTWDTYRATHPLYLFTQPERSADFINSMLAISEQGGMLPVWHLVGWETQTMVGLSSEQIVSEAYLKGLEGFDAERAFAELKKSATSDYRGMNYVRDLKYIPSGEGGIGESVAMAMELAIGDASIARMARAMGKTDEYEYFSKRAELYKLYWDAKTGFFRGRLTDGTFNPLFDPMKTVRPWSADYTEGSAWHYLWLVPHDVAGLTELIGGEERFVQRLDSLFTLPMPEGEEVLSDVTGLIGQYAHGNEPSHHVAYLYAYAGQQWKTARLVRQIMREFYNDTPDGLIGNEDCGQMSAWYVLSAMGFYPVFTASCDYVIGSPAVPRATMKLSGGVEFTVETTDWSPENIYVQSATLNGADYPKSFISHGDIAAGGVLKLTMGPEPNPDFGLAAENRPPNLF